MADVALVEVSCCDCGAMQPLFNKIRIRCWGKLYYTSHKDPRDPILCIQAPTLIVFALILWGPAFLGSSPHAFVVTVGFKVVVPGF